MEKCWKGGWKIHYKPTEVGCRGFAGCSLCKVLNQLGLTRLNKKRAIQSISKVAEKATRWLKKWIKRADPWAAQVRV